MFCSFCCPAKKDSDEVESPSWFSDLETKGTKLGDPIDSAILKEESFITVTIAKPAPDALLGIAYQKSHPNSWRIVITKLTPLGLAAKTNVLQVGQTILSVNDTPCTEWESARDLTTLFRSIPDTLTLVVTNSVTSTVFKASADIKVGIVFCQAEHAEAKKDAIYIYLLAPDGLFSKAGILHVGMRVLALNGKCPDSLEEARRVVKECVGYLSIVAVATPEDELPFPASDGLTSPPSVSSLSDGEPDERKK